jgi:hypothetical protein
VRALNEPRNVGSGVSGDYDGVVEIWWDSAEDFLESLETEEGKAAWAEIAADEPNFANYKLSYTYVGEEIQIFP